MGRLPCWRFWNLCTKNKSDKTGVARISFKRINLWILFLSLSTVFILLPQKSAYSKEFRWSKDISPEIKYTHIKRFTRRGPLHIHILKIDTSSPNINLRPAIAKRKIGTIERVDRIARRENAIVAVNGSFFESRKTPHLPVGILIADGAVINKSLLNRTAMGITEMGDLIFGIPKIKGEVLIPATKKRFEIWGVNRPRKQDEVILYTPEYGKTSKTNKWGKEVIVSKGKVVAHSIGNSKIPADGCVLSFHGRSRKFIEKLRIGSDIIITFGLNEDWEMTDHAITAGPLLLKDGKVMVKRSVIAEKFGGLILKPTARTAVGKDKSGRLLLFVVDKRQGISIGVTFSELAEIMREEGAVEGMALDGGGTSTMVIDGTIKNYPMYGYAAPVSNALIVEKAGYKYIAKKPSPKPQPEPKVEVEVKVEVKVEEAEAKDALIDIYEKLILSMFVTREVEY